MAGPMVVKSNIWLEMDGQVVLSRWRVRLLLAIKETGSITQAAKIMRIPYRRAWEKIHQSEERLGLKLVDTQVGGAGGGGATLTPACLDLIDRYTALTKGVATSLQQRFEEVF